MPSTDGVLDRFHVLVMLGNVAVNMDVQVSLWHTDLTAFRDIPYNMYLLLFHCFDQIPETIKGEFVLP